jgi:hypothetical protein
LERELPLDRLLPDRELPLERLPLDRDELLPDRDEPERLLPLDRDELLPDREELPLDREELPLDRAELDRLLPDRDELERLRPLELLPLDRLLPLERPLLRLLPLDRLPLDRDEDELDRELLDDRRRDLPPLRSAAGISSRATALASCSICFSRNFAIRSSSRRMVRASFAVSLSPTVSASDSRPVYWPISWNSSVSSVRAFFSIFSASPVPRSAWSGPCAAATALLATDVSPVAASASTSGPLVIGPASALPPSCLMRRSTSRACPRVSLRWSCSRFRYVSFVVMAI